MARLGIVPLGVVLLLVPVREQRICFSQTGGPAQVTDAMLRAAVTDTVNWLAYGHDYTGNRFSRLAQINQANVHRLQVNWTFQFPAAMGLTKSNKIECSPIVVNGVLYLTGAGNRIYAVEARTGRLLWQRVEPLHPDVRGCCGPMNRGAAVYEDKVYWTTYDGRLLCLSAATGTTVWEQRVADPVDGYSITGAPLMVKGKVISGLSGEGRRGYLSAFDARTGVLVWRHWSTPALGEPGSETWGGAEPLGCSPWHTGSYDPELDQLYWQFDGPAPNWNGDVRPGDNLFSDCIMALNPDTGERIWYFQVIPHEVWDYDAIGELVLADVEVKGVPRKILFQANRGGFFVVLDRVTGQFLHGAPFIDNLNWATGLDPVTGRPQIDESKVPKAGMEPVHVAPHIGGGKNWAPMAYSPRTRLAYFYASETSTTFYPPTVFYVDGQPVWRSGYPDEGPDPRRYNWSRIVAVDVTTANRVWDYIPESGTGSGALATAGGLVFIGESGGWFTALHEATGDRLWTFNIGASIVAPASTFTVDGKQHLVVGAGNHTFFSFSLPTDEVATDEVASRNSR